MTYRPLPKEVTIKLSPIEGLGLFATCNLPDKHQFGITHIQDKEFEDGYARTALGSFFNHSEDPNCECYIEGRFLKLKSIKEIKSGNEITVKYWLYEIK